MSNTKKFRKFVEAIKGVAFWSRELLKVIDNPENKRRKKTEPKCAQQDKRHVDE